jgi:protein-disulfide isomerase
MKPAPQPVSPRLSQSRDVFVIKRSTLLSASLIVAALVVAGVFAYTNLLAKQNNTAELWKKSSIYDLVTDDDPSIGPKNAPVTIVEFSDFRCEYCKVFHDQVQASLLNQYGDKLRFIYRDFPTSGGHALAEAAGCAKEQNAYWPYHDALFSAPQLYSSEDDLVTLASSLSMDPRSFRDCYSSGRYSAEVEQDYQTGLAFGVRGTPTFFINGQMLVGTQSPAVFQALIDQHLQKVGG